MPQFIKHVEENFWVLFHNKIGVVMPIDNEKALFESLQHCIIFFSTKCTCVKSNDLESIVPKHTTNTKQYWVTFGWPSKFSLINPTMWGDQRLGDNEEGERIGDIGNARDMRKLGL